MLKMNWLVKLIDWIKLPFGFVVTATSIMSGFLLFSSDETLRKLSLISFRTKHGETIGVIFIVSIGLLFAFVLFRAPATLKRKFKRIKMKYFPDKILLKLNSVERGLVFAIYNSPNHTMNLDFNDPVVKSMVARNILFSGTTQFLEYNVLTNTYNTLYTLQPFAQRGVEKLYHRLEGEIEELRNKQIQNLNQKQTEIINKQLEQKQQILDKWRSQ